MASVTLRNIDKTFTRDEGGDAGGVRDVSLEIQDREFVVLTGPSDCGQSTILRMIAGLEEVSSGDIFLGERRINDLTAKDRDVAMVFQNYALYPHWSVFENMAFGLKLKKLSRLELKRRVEEAAAMLGLEQLLDEKPAALPGPKRLGVALGRAVVCQPKVLLFDDPLSNLPSEMRGGMQAEILKLQRHWQTTLIYVTRDQGEAMAMGSRVVVMDGLVNPETKLLEGVVHQFDAPLHLYHKPATRSVAGFIGRPPMNFLHGQLVSKNGAVFFREKDGSAFSVVIPQPPTNPVWIGPEVVLGFRPEDCLPVQIEGRSSSGDCFNAVVDFVEPRGAETLLTLQTESHRLRCRAPGGYAHEITGRRLSLRLDLEKLHLFDSSTGRRIE